MEITVLNEGAYLNLLLTMIEIIVRIVACCAGAGLAVYFGGVVWLCFEETRQRARRWRSPECNEEALLAALAALNDELAAMRRAERRAVRP